MQNTYKYHINFAGTEENATRPFYEGTVKASTIAMAAHRGILHARQGSGNRLQFDRVTEMYITITEVKD